MEKVTFVIGAGASYDADNVFPMGAELQRQIVGALEMIDQFYEKQECSEEWNPIPEVHSIIESVRYYLGISPEKSKQDEYMGIDEDIRNKLLNASSVDNFIHQQNNEAILAWVKSAIAYLILEAEKKAGYFHGLEKRKILKYQMHFLIAGTKNFLI